MILLIHVTLIGTLMPVLLTESLQPSTTPDVSTINTLKDKMFPPSIDPKLRRALIRVLSKLEKGTLPIDANTELKDEDFIKIFGSQPAAAEDLGSIESREIQDDTRTIKPTKRPEIVKPMSKAPEKLLESLNANLFTFIKPMNNKIKTQTIKSTENPLTSSFVYSGSKKETVKPLGIQENQPTKPTPELHEIFFQMPTPIDIPDQVKDYLDDQIVDTMDETNQKELDINDQSHLTIRSKHNSNYSEDAAMFISESVMDDEKDSNSTEKDSEKNYKHEVEFLPSALLTAFTVQQDDQGIPRKVIPLTYLHQHKALVEKKQKELAEKEYRLQQQLKSLQEEKYRFHGALKNDGLFSKLKTQFSTTNFPPTNRDVFTEIIASKEQFLNDQATLLRDQEFQRQRDLDRQEELLRQQEIQRQREINRLQESIRQQELLRNQELQKLKELQRQREEQSLNRPFNTRDNFFPHTSPPPNFDNFQQNFNQFPNKHQPNVDFQKSLDYRVPTQGSTPIPITSYSSSLPTGPSINHYSPSQPPTHNHNQFNPSQPTNHNQLTSSSFAAHPTGPNRNPISSFSGPSSHPTGPNHNQLTSFGPSHHPTGPGHNQFSPPHPPTGPNHNHQFGSGHPTAPNHNQFGGPPHPPAVPNHNQFQSHHIHTHPTGPAHNQITSFAPSTGPSHSQLTSFNPPPPHPAAPNHNQLNSFNPLPPPPPPPPNPVSLRHNHLTSFGPPPGPPHHTKLTSFTPPPNTPSHNQLTSFTPPKPRGPNHNQLSSFGPLSNYNQYRPGIELNRVNRKEPKQYVGNYGHNHQPHNVDYQLQNLIAESGLSSFIPSDNKDDLNIVSKVLSLNHVGILPSDRDSTSRHSDDIPTFVTPPPSIIEPPEL